MVRVEGFTPGAARGQRTVAPLQGYLVAQVPCVHDDVEMMVHPWEQPQLVQVGRGGIDHRGEGDEAKRPVGRMPNQDARVGLREKRLLGRQKNPRGAAGPVGILRRPFEKPGARGIQRGRPVREYQVISVSGFHGCSLPGIAERRNDGAPRRRRL